jgi:hypothetical protein
MSEPIGSPKNNAKHAEGRLFAEAISQNFLAIALAYAIGVGSSTILGKQPWQWNSPLSITCLLLAAFCAGGAIVSFLRLRNRRKETTRVRSQIQSSIEYAEQLRARAVRADASTPRAS